MHVHVVQGSTGQVCCVSPQGTPASQSGLQRWPGCSGFAIVNLLPSSRAEALLGTLHWSFVAILAPVSCVEFALIQPPALVSLGTLTGSLWTVFFFLQASITRQAHFAFFFLYVDRTLTVDSRAGLFVLLQVERQLLQVPSSLGHASLFIVGVMFGSAPAGNGGSCRALLLAACARFFGVVCGHAHVTCAVGPSGHLLLCILWHSARPPCECKIIGCTCVVL